MAAEVGWVAWRSSEPPLLIVDPTPWCWKDGGFQGGVAELVDAGDSRGRWLNDLLPGITLSYGRSGAA